MYGGRNPSASPPCNSCMPEFREENRDALKIFALIKNQYIMGMNGPIEINHVAVWKAIEKYAIERECETFEKVIRLSGWMLNRIKGKNENQ